MIMARADWKVILLFLGSLVVTGVEAKHPNVIILLADDLGIGDVGCYGNDTIRTPNIDKLGREGVKLMHHLSAASVCSPSRAALLTARYPARYGLVGDHGTTVVVRHTASRVGLPQSEVTLATALASANYTTAAVGKWHQGMQCGLLGQNCLGPKHHGFQSFFGMPIGLIDKMEDNNPFWIFPLTGPDPFYKMIVTVWVVLVTWALWGKWRLGRIIVCLSLLTIVSCVCWFAHTHYRLHTERWWRISPWAENYLNRILMDGDRVVEQPVVLNGLMQRLVKRSVDFIKEHADNSQPFFLLHSFLHVHVPMFTAEGNAGRSAHGRYGDNVEEMDDGVGEILAALDKHHLAESTIVYFVSDHGGHLEAIDKEGQRVGGHNGKFKGGKGQGGSEGGIRVPGIFRWPGHIPAGTIVNTPTSLLDTLPTILQLAGLPPLPELLPHLPERELDGLSLADQLTGKSDLPSRSLLHHCGRDIHAVRLAYENMVYKMQLVGYKWSPGSMQCGWGNLNFCSCFNVEDYGHLPLLFELTADPYEDSPIPQNSTRYIQVTGVMKQFLAEWRATHSYPPSQFSSKLDTMHSMWLQPFASIF